MNTQQQTSEQGLIASALARQFGIDKTRVFFPDANNPQRPWLGADELIVIARQSKLFQAIEESFSTFIPGLNQVVHTARVINTDGQMFERSGVATMGERSPGGGDYDEHGLAATRALVSTLSAAGFNPLKAGSVVASAKQASATPTIMLDQEEPDRKSQLRQIHALAEETYLIVYGEKGRDDTRYRQFLIGHFGVDSVKAMTIVERDLVINKLMILKQEIENL